MLEIRKLSAGYPGNPVLKDVTLSIPEGKVTVVAGPNGCGKSTLLKALAGILSRQGEIYLQNQPLHGLPQRELARHLAFLPQNRPVPEITAQRLVLHGRFPYLSYPRHYRPEDHRIAREAMEQLGIGDLAERSVSSLSGGQRQKVYLAMALAQDTQVLLLDEPTTYLDIRHQLQLMQLSRLLADSGKTLILVLHDLSLAMEYADHLVILENGTVAAQGSPGEVFASGVLPHVFGVEVRRTKTEDGWKYYCKDNFSSDM